MGSMSLGGLDMWVWGAMVLGSVDYRDHGVLILPVLAGYAKCVR